MDDEQEQNGSKPEPTPRQRATSIMKDMSEQATELGTLLTRLTGACVLGDVDGVLDVADAVVVYGAGFTELYRKLLCVPLTSTENRHLPLLVSGIHTDERMSC